MLPGDAASAILGRLATPEALADLRAELGLDRPLHEQYLDWIGNLLSGDLGHSVTNKQPVSELIGYRIVNTLVAGADHGHLPGSARSLSRNVERHTGRPAAGPGIVAR